MNQLFSISSSTGGARAKALIAWNRKTNEICSGQIDNLNDSEYYLIKFDEPKTMATTTLKILKATPILNIPII